MNQSEAVVKSYLTEQPKKSPLLEEHNKRFKRRIEKVTDTVYVAIGYAYGNSILIVTEEGNIIVDTTESVKYAEEIRKDFDKISPKETVAVIYTHAHHDHIFGTSAFANNQTEIYAHARIKELFDAQFSQLSKALNKRGARQMGMVLPVEWTPCSGQGPLPYNLDIVNPPKLLKPTKLYENELELTIGGTKLVLFYTPGETEDQTAVWLPDQKVLMSGDTYYPSFPNLYTIRGTTYRPVDKWIESIDKLRDKEAEFLVPSHAEAITGKENVEDLLTAYRDAIQYVFDAVLRGANQEKSPDELVEEIKLPTHLADHPSLKELYGEVGWSVRAIYQGHLGWFDGNASNLHPLTKREKTERFSSLLGRLEPLLEEAKKALDDKDYRWVCELCDMVICLENDHKAAKKMKAESLFRLGELSNNSNARGYYMHSAAELNGELSIEQITNPVSQKFATDMPIENFMKNLSIMLDPEKTLTEHVSASISFTDLNEQYQVIVRRGIAEVKKGALETADIGIQLPTSEWRALFIDSIPFKEWEKNSRIQINKGQEKIAEFISWFQ